MGTQNINLERYKNLWNIFNNLLKDRGLNLSSFSKEWEKISDTGNESNDYNRFYPKLKKMYQRINSVKTVRRESIHQMEEYIKFLDSKFVIEELRDDEKFEHWFD
ncbi:hypothetical protein [Aliarcobacter cryaerophilus]|uniref:Uncharacterized protein n=1 Tax=Arcobacter sp. AZ-2023 TaxID=3074453 RepID=A0AA96DJE6_9BACT|nr:hypothetical protein RMQ68_09650 [Arcobacter sp. AZ-2023]